MKFWHYMGPPNDKINGINLVIRKNLYMTLTFCPIERFTVCPCLLSGTLVPNNLMLIHSIICWFFRLFWQIYQNSVDLVIEWSIKVYSLVWRVFYTLQNGNRKKNGHDPYKNGTFFVSNTISQSPTATKMSNRMLLKTCLIRTN